MQTTSFDVIVVGSGASGGWAAKRLSEAGIKVALLEAGKPQGDADFTEHVPAYQLTYRDRASDWIRRTRPTQRDCYACREWNYKWFVNDLEEPYTTPDNKPFSWQGRTRVVGGRTNVWGRQSYRFSDQDLHGKSFDGYGEDWPISYADLVPYYELVEDYVGISGQAENVPELPDSRFHPAMPMSCAETQLRTRVKSRLGYTVTIGRAANITRPINGRGACHYCGPCEQGCVTHSYFNAAFTTVADALKSGNTTLITNAMVYKVLTDPSTHRRPRDVHRSGHARGARGARPRGAALRAGPRVSPHPVQFGRGRPRQFERRARALPDGLHLGGRRRGRRVPGCPGAQAVARCAAASERALHDPDEEHHERATREELPARLRLPGRRLDQLPDERPGYGAAFKKGVLDPVTAINLVGFGEVLPRYDNFVAIDPAVVDTFGIPVLRISMSWGENEKAMIPDMAVTATTMLEAAGAKNIQPFTVLDRIPGYGIHEMGTARMGRDPKTSVLNQFLQTHDIGNLYVMDASSFVSGGCQNPTLTIMALAVRGCDHLMEEMKRGTV